MLSQFKQYSMEFCSCYWCSSLWPHIDADLVIFTF